MNESKRQYLPTQISHDLPPYLPPGLWVVATPIGNLADLTQRAREALAAAQVVYCEDTRRTSKLLSVLGLRPRLERLDAHASAQRIAQVVDVLEGMQGIGQGAALVTDAGTPGISDPGARLVAAARARKIQVTPVPGCSAVVTLLSVAGWESPGFAFRGFFPRKASERLTEIKRAAASGLACVWFESPERVVDTLRVLGTESPQVPVFVGKELTKLHERFFSGTAESVAFEVNAEIALEGAIGEWAFAADFSAQTRAADASSKNPNEVPGDAGWEKALACCIEARVSASEAARRVSQHFGVARNLVYERALEVSGKKSQSGG